MLAPPVDDNVYHRCMDSPVKDDCSSCHRQSGTAYAASSIHDVSMEDCGAPMNTAADDMSVETADCNMVSAADCCFI